MKVRLKLGTSLSVLLFVCLPTIGIGQQRYGSGPYKGFVKEEPELNKVIMDEPIKVSRVEGVVNYPREGPLANVCFEIRDSSGRVLSAVTDAQGKFLIRKVRPGTYDFKVSRNKFQSVVGTLQVSPKRLKNKGIRIQLQLGT